MVQHSMVSFDGYGRRLMGIGGVVLVHLLLIGFILSGLPKFKSVPRAVREMFLILRPAPQPQKKDLPRGTATARPSLPIYTPPPASPTAPATTKLSISLFECAPGSFGRPSPEDQEKCAHAGIGPAPPNAASMLALRSHVRDPARRLAELAARRTPARVPCAHIETQVVQNIVQQHSVIVDPLCAAGELLRAARR